MKIKDKKRTERKKNIIHANSKLQTEIDYLSKRLLHPPFHLLMMAILKMAAFTPTVVLTHILYYIF